MNDIQKDGRPVVPLCKDCDSFLRGSIGVGPTCSSKMRPGNFDPVYGWQARYRNPYEARADNSDCGLAGNYWVAQPLKVSEENIVEVPLKKKNFFSKFFPY